MEHGHIYSERERGDASIAEVNLVYKVVAFQHSLQSFLPHLTLLAAGEGIDNREEAREEEEEEEDDVDSQPSRN